jgi:glyoxylase-like metal-dependent hydrolase (beta-lactamase superfamily II)
VTRLSTEFSPRPNLRYPFGRDWHPEPGEPFEVAEGIYWLRMPMPLDLNHINLWLLKDGDKWVIVDTGYDAEMCQDVWEIVFDKFLKPSDVSKIIVTHFHPDHIGLASWLAHQCDCKIHVTKGEFEMYRYMFERDTDEFVNEVKAFIREIGFSAGLQETYVSLFSDNEQKPDLMRVQRGMENIIAEGDEICIGENDWRIVVGSGHSAEHACLYCERLEVMISGDQVLPRISSNVSVFVSNVDTDPLRNWLRSCDEIKQKIPSQTLVLPAHQEPFTGVGMRLQQLIDDHHAQLNKLRLLFREKGTALDACKVLFDRELSVNETLFAMGEALAHINYLVYQKELNKTVSADGVAYYTMLSPPE